MRKPIQFLISICLLCGSMIFAQDPTSISGKVVDSNGAPIPGASVRIAKGEDSKLAETLTDMDGAFSIETLPAGIYRVTVETVGFNAVTQDALDTSSETSKKLVFQMKSPPRPPTPKVAQTSSKEQGQQMPPTISFEAAEVTDLPGMNRFQLDTSSTGIDTASVATRTDNLLLISGNSASLDAGNMNDMGFRREIMDMAQRMGFQMQESGSGSNAPGGQGGSGFAMGGGGGFGGGGMGGPGGGGPGGGGMGFTGMAGRGGRGANFKQPVVQGSISETYNNSALNARSYSITGRVLPKPVTIGNSYSLTLGGNLPFFKSQTTTTSRQGTNARQGSTATNSPQGSSASAPLGSATVSSATSSQQGSSAASSQQASTTTSSKPAATTTNSKQASTSSGSQSASSTSRGSSGGGPQGFMGPGGRGGRAPTWNFSYSGNHNRNASDILTTVPTDLERAGDFSKTLVNNLVFDTTTGKTAVLAQPLKLYSNPNDPSSQFTQVASIDPIAQGLLQYIPRANMTCAADGPCTKNYFRQRTNPSSSDQFQVRISQIRLTSKDSVSVNYSIRKGNSQNTATFPGLDSSSTNASQSYGLSGNHSFKQRLILNWQVNLNRTRNESTNPFAYVNNVEGNLGITGVSKDPINYGIPTIGFTNYGGLSLSNPTLSKSQNLTVSGSMQKIQRKHSLQFGGQFAATQRNSYSDSNGRGTFSFSGYATALLDSTGRQITGSGYDFADFLLGLPYSTSRRYVDPQINPYGKSTYLRNRSYSFYAQDNWQYRSNLTINYGIRYEYSGPTYEKYNRMVSLDTNSAFTTVAQVFPDQVGSLSHKYFPRSIVSADRNNVGPRIGIAWRPTRKSPFVIRAGYSIGYDTGGFSGITGQLVNQSPFAVNQNTASTRANPLSLRVGFPTIPNLTILNTYAIDPNYRAPYAQQWNLDLQIALTQVNVVTIGYSGSKGTGLDFMRVPNRTTNASLFQYQTNGANSIYNGVSVQYSHRFSRGFNMSTNYTLAKTIDEGSGGGGSSAVAQNDNNLRGERGLSSQDQRHNFQASSGFDLPFGKSRMFFANSSDKLLNFISGWNFNGSFTMSSGSPLTARYINSSGNSTGAALYNSLRADATGVSVSLPKNQRSIQEFFNTAAFSIPSGQYGTAGRNTITGPGSVTVNMSVRKSFRLDENNRRIDLNWNVQNLLNHPNWSGIGTTVNSNTFGQVTGARGMRSMTARLNINF
jgi:trimeric autotransporter adhesin